MEIRQIRSRLQTRKESLLNCEYNLAKKYLSDFLNYIQDNDIIFDHIQKIADIEKDWTKWESSLWTSEDYDMPIDEKQSAKFCYQVLVRYKEDLVSISSNFYTGSNRITEHVQNF